MPIEILPEGENQWFETSAKPNILFMTLDPFWKTKTGSSSPMDAILYRGGQGFLERSTDGGVNWSSILPSTNPPWFVSGAMWTSVHDPYEPLPRPANGEPSYNNEIPAPVASALTYHGYTSSKTRSGEHCVLVTYTAANSAGYLDQANYNNELSVAWVLSTFNDWATHDWQQVIMNVDRGKGAPQSSSATNVYTNTTNPSGHDAIKTDTNLYAVFYRLGTTVYCTMMSESGGTLTKHNTASQSGGVWGNLWADSNGNVYIGRINNEDDGGKRRYFAEVDKWDCSGTTPSRTARYTSSWLPDYNTTTHFGSGYAFYLTPSGRFAFIYYNYDSGGGPPYSNDVRMWHWFYFDILTNNYSTPYKFLDGTAGGGIPWGIDVSCNAIDGGNKCAFNYIENLNWTNRLQDDYFGYTFIMEIGTWTQLDKTQWLDEEDETLGWFQIVGASKLWSDNRWCFYHTRSQGATAYMFSYDSVNNTLDRIPYTVSADNGDSASGASARCIREDPASILGFVGDHMHWSDDSLFPEKSVQITDPAITNIKCGFGDLSRYIRVVESFSSPNYLLDASIVTIPDKPPDDIFSRFGHNPSICYQPDGNRVFICLPSYSDGVDGMAHVVDILYREPNGQTGRVDYLDDYTLYYWSDWDYSFTKAEYLAGDTYVGVMPWVDEAPDGVLFFGLPYGVNFPTWPDQIYGYSAAQGEFYIWGVNGFVDPCRAIVDIGGRLYAVAQSATVLKLYEAKATMADDGANMVYVSDLPLDDANYGNVMDVDTLDNTFAVAAGSADVNIVAIAAPPWTSWTDVTLNHRVDRGVTGLIVFR